MFIIEEANQQLKINLPRISIFYSALLFFLISVFVLCRYYNIPVGHITRDPNVILQGSPFVGFVSNIGILIWCLTAAICFFSAVIFKVYSGASSCSKEKFSKFLLFSGLLTLFLLFDDFFTFHEVIFPNYLHIHEKLVYLTYLAAVALYFYKFYEEIIETDYVLLFIACGFFALSLTVDVLFEVEGVGYLFEDGFKLFGILTWSVYFVKTCFSRIIRLLRPT